MIDGLTMFPALGPGKDAIARSIQAGIEQDRKNALNARYLRERKLVSVHVRKFDLLVPAEAEAYGKFYLEMMENTTNGAWQIAYDQRVLKTDTEVPMLLQIVEYHVFNLTQKDLALGVQDDKRQEPETTETELSHANITD